MVFLLTFSSMLGAQGTIIIFGNEFKLQLLFHIFISFKLCCKLF
jgi:hypothetical protein